MAINYKGWQADLIKEHEIGVVLDPDPKKGAMQLLPVLDDGALMEAFGQNARRLAIESFSRDTLAAHLLAVLEDAVAMDSVRGDRAEASIT